jgi:hypothetical protein
MVTNNPLSRKAVLYSFYKKNTLLYYNKKRIEA